jgi:hypothetical protein
MSTQRGLTADSKGGNRSYAGVQKTPLYGHNITNPGYKTWDEYKTVPKETRDLMKQIIGPLAYVSLHFDKNTFGSYYHSIHGNLKASQVTFLDMGATQDDGTIVMNRVTSKQDLKQCATRLERCKQVWKRNETIIYLNIMQGLLSMDKIFGLRLFWRHGNRDDGTKTTEGFMTYFYQKPAGNEKKHAYVIVTHDGSYTMFFAAEDQHAEAIHFMNNSCKIQTLRKICAYCGSGNTLKKCPCKDVRYCSTVCQLKHWSLHKTRCSPRYWKMPLQDVEAFLVRKGKGEMCLLDSGSHTELGSFDGPGSPTELGSQIAREGVAKAIIQEPKEALLKADKMTIARTRVPRDDIQMHEDSVRLSSTAAPSWMLDILSLMECMDALEANLEAAYAKYEASLASWN